jgi:hypothetical protein
MPWAVIGMMAVILVEPGVAKDAIRGESMLQEAAPRPSPTPTSPTPTGPTPTPRPVEKPGSARQIPQPEVPEQP